MRSYPILELLRIKQMAKQTLVLLPVIATGSGVNLSNITSSFLALLSFVLASGFVYVVNDLKDVKSDQTDSTKAKRPYASGRVTSAQMILFASLFFVCAFIFALAIGENFLKLASILVLYCLINFLYSYFHLKEYKILGIVIVGVGFPLRFVYGSLALNLPLSPWSFVLLFQLAVFMLAGKRYQTNKRRRAPSKNLTTNSELDFWLLALVSLGALFSSSYIGFVMNQENQLQWGFEPLLISTVPIGLGILRYLEIVTHPDMYEDSDATESMLKDKFLIFLVLLFSGVLAYGRYVHS